MYTLYSKGFAKTEHLFNSIKTNRKSIYTSKHAVFVFNYKSCT